MTGLHFWVRGYCVSTVGLDEDTIRRYIQEQEKLDRGQGTLDFESPQRPQRGLPSRDRPPWGALPHTTRYAGGW